MGPMRNAKLTMIFSVLLFSNSCTLSSIVSTPYNVDFYEVGFFTEENKPDHYQRMYNDSKPNFVSVNDKEDGGSGEKWAISQTEQKIRERAVREGFNGVILVRFHSVTRLAYSGNIRDNVTTYYQVYIPINYDQELYQAPLTDFQKKSKYFKRKSKRSKTSKKNGN